MEHPNLLLLDTQSLFVKAAKGDVTLVEEEGEDDDSELGCYSMDFWLILGIGDGMISNWSVQIFTRSAVGAPSNLGTSSEWADYRYVE